jgi:hypothetical protein
MGSSLSFVQMTAVLGQFSLPMDSVWQTWMGYARDWAAARRSLNGVPIVMVAASRDLLSGPLGVFFLKGIFFLL